MLLGPQGWLLRLVLPPALTEVVDARQGFVPRRQLARSYVVVRLDVATLQWRLPSDLQFDWPALQPRLMRRWN